MKFQFREQFFKLKDAQVAIFDQAVMIYVRVMVQLYQTAREIQFQIEWVKTISSANETCFGSDNKFRTLQFQ